MYSLTVSDHIMIAHGFVGDEFGPAKRLHGVTYVVEVEFRAGTLDHHQLLIDIGLAKRELRVILDTIDYTNLDDYPEFKGINTTTEFMAFWLHGRISEACLDGRLGDGGRGVASLKLLLREAPNAWAAFEGPLATEGA